MRLALSLAFALAAAPAFAKPVYNAPADVQSVTTFVKQNAVELNLDKAMSHYAPDAVVYDLAGPPYKGHAQIRADFAPQLAGIKSISASYPSVNVFSDGTMACAATQMRDDLILSTGAKSQVSVRLLDVLRKVDGKWLIEQEHLSFPADQKTGLSLLNATQTPAIPVVFATSPFLGPKVSAVHAKAQIKDWTTSFATTMSPDAVLALVGPGDNELIFDPYFPAPVQGSQAIKTTYTPFFAQLANAQVNFVDFTAISDGYVGAQIDTQKLVLKMKDGSTVFSKLRQSDCMHYVDGRWYSVFDELSFPIDMKTGKAVMN